MAFAAFLEMCAVNLKIAIILKVLGLVFRRKAVFCSIMFTSCFKRCFALKENYGLGPDCMIAKVCVRECIVWF